MALAVSPRTASGCRLSTAPTPSVAGKQDVHQDLAAPCGAGFQSILAPLRTKSWPRTAGVPRAPGHIPIPTARGILLRGKHTCECLNCFAHRHSHCDLVLRGQCPLGTLVMSHPTWPSISCTSAFPRPRFRQASPSQGKSLRHVVPSLGAPSLHSPRTFPPPHLPACFLCPPFIRF